MEFLELAKTRFSCRSFSNRNVEQSLIDQILEAAIAAPTAVNKQDFKLWVLASDQAKQNIRQVTDYTFGANHFIIVGARKQGSWTRSFDEKNFSEVDAAIVGAHIMLEIADLGLASTWVGYFDAPKLQQLYPQMAEYELVALFPFGYAADGVQPSKGHTHRKTKEDLVEIL